MFWLHLLPGFFKFNIDGAARRKGGPAGIGGVLKNDESEMSNLFQEYENQRIQ